MTALAQLHSLWRLFPRATELAVSRQLARQYEEEAVANIRYRLEGSYIVPSYPVERFATITAQRFPMTYRGKPLTIVEPIHA